MRTALKMSLLYKHRKDENMFEMSRWDPFEEMMSLREAMNRLMEESFLVPGRALSSVGSRLTARWK